MIFLAFSIFCSVITVSFFKLFDRFQVNLFQAIVCNYFVCMLTGNIISDKPIITTSFWNEPWFPFTLALGLLLISIFYCIAETTQRMGLSVSMVAAKLSVVIPVLFAVFFHHEHVSFIKVFGIFLSLLAVYFISKKNEIPLSGIKYLWVLPFIVFTGSGVIDTLLKYIQSVYIPPADTGSIVSTAFLMAFSFGLIFFVYQNLLDKKHVQTKNILWGCALGIPNYFSIFFLVKTLESYRASFIFPVNNISIVVFSTLTSLLFFKEKLSPVNWAGFSLATVSILIISLS